VVKGALSLLALVTLRAKRGACYVRYCPVLDHCWVSPNGDCAQGPLLLPTGSTFEEGQGERGSIKDAHAGIFFHPAFPFRGHVGLERGDVLRDYLRDCTLGRRSQIGKSSAHAIPRKSTHRKALLFCQLEERGVEICDSLRTLGSRPGGILEHQYVGVIPAKQSAGDFEAVVVFLRTVSLTLSMPIDGANWG
jgi:hypothetical protein